VSESCTGDGVESELFSTGIVAVGVGDVTSAAELIASSSCSIADGGGDVEEVSGD